MKRLVVGFSLIALLSACSSSPSSGDDGGGGDGGTANDGDCPEKDAMLAIQDLAVDPAGPGGSKVTNFEGKEIRNAIEKVPSDC